MENRLITEQLAEQIAKYPLYSQDGLGKAAICIGILELANIKWYVLEGQQEETITRSSRLWQDWPKQNMATLRPMSLQASKWMAQNMDWGRCRFSNR